MMKFFTRWLSYTTAVLGLLSHIQITDKLMHLGYAKIFSAAGSPFLVVIGLFTAWLAGRRRDWPALFASLFGTTLAAHYIATVTAPHDDFALAFGDQPQQKRPVHPPLRSRRYTLRPIPLPQAQHQPDIPIAHTPYPVLADLWQPPAGVARSGLGLIYLHGSAWHYTDKDFGTRPFFRYLAGQGHVVLDVAYTLAPRADLYGMVGDVKRAIGWLKTQAAAFGIRPDGVVLMGGSAGGHLALLAAYTPNHPELQPEGMEQVDTAVCGVISYYGISDLTTAHIRLQLAPGMSHLTDTLEPIFKRYRLLPDYGKLVDSGKEIASFLRCQPEENPALYRLGSPLYQVGAHCPPTLLINGAHDFAVDVTQHGRLAAALRQAHIPVIHRELPYTDHAFDLFLPQWNPATHTAWYDTERFLGVLKGKRET